MVTKPPPRQNKLPGLDPGIQSKAITQSERHLREQCVTVSAYHQFEVLEIGQVFKRPRCPACSTFLKVVICPACHESFRPPIPTSNAPGAPDLFVLDKKLAENRWKGIELKASKTANVRREQERLIAAGWVDCVWSLPQYLDHLRRE